MSADALSDVLRTVRLTGATFFDIVATAPWVAEQPPRENILPKILPGAGHLIAYHVVTEGRCFTNLIGEEPVEVEAGEVIVFTKGDQHVLSSSPGMRADPGAPSAHDAVPGSQLPFLINLGGDDGPASARFVCGFLACDAQPFNPLLDNLPPIIKTGVPQGGDQGWLGQFIRVAMMESAEKRAGGESVLAKLSELMFIEVVRRHLEALPPEQAGWLAGSARSLRRQGIVADARKARAQLDDRGSGQGRRPVALGAGGAFRRPRRHAADALSRQMADADRLRAARRRHRQYCKGRRRDRLWLRSGLQPRFQEDGGGAPFVMAPPRPGAGGRRGFVARLK